MEKFSVQQTPPAKTSSVEIVCPLCKALAERRGNILICPAHGSAPWEKTSSGSPTR